MIWDRFDICTAYWQYYADWHEGGLTARDRARTGPSIAMQLHRMGFELGASHQGLESLSESEREIYGALVAKWEGGL